MSGYAFHPEAFTDLDHIREFIADPAERDQKPKTDAFPTHSSDTFLRCLNRS